MGGFMLQEFLKEWWDLKISQPDYRIEEYLRQKYMELHEEDLGSQEERETAFDHLIRQWREGMERIVRESGRYSDQLNMEEWQASEMLDNVIHELEMPPAEQYRYLLNVKLLCCYKLSGRLDLEARGDVRKAFEQEYETEWERADDVNEAERSEMYAKTVHLMQIADITYSDDTRRILAKIGAGEDVSFPENEVGQEREELCLLADFCISQMVQGDAKQQYTKEEKTVLTQRVVPVCTAAAILVSEGRSSDTMGRIVESSLGYVFEEKNLKLLLSVAVVSMAARLVLSLIKFSVLGIFAGRGLDMLWENCWQALDWEQPVRRRISASLLMRSLKNVFDRKRVPQANIRRVGLEEKLAREEIYE